MSKILFDDYPLVVPTELAAAVGLNEAIILQQVHYWCNQNKRLRQNEKEGHYWTYNSVREWKEQFPFWSEKTINRAIKTLEEKSLLLTGCFNRMKMDRTKWYRVNMEKLAEIYDRAEKIRQEEERMERKGRLYNESIQRQEGVPERVLTKSEAVEIGREIEAEQQREKFKQKATKARWG